MESRVVRIWSTGIDESRSPEYNDFTVSTSLPMFRRHSGFLGVLFAGAASERAVITIWSDQAAVAALEASADYKDTVRMLEATGFLRPPQRVERLAVHGSWAEPFSHAVWNVHNIDEREARRR